MELGSSSAAEGVMLVMVWIAEVQSEKRWQLFGRRD